jgi:hypothetical protein
MYLEIGTEAPIFLFWEYMLQIFFAVWDEELTIIMSKLSNKHGNNMIASMRVRKKDRDMNKDLTM